MKLSNLAPKIDELLGRADLVALLRRFRNGNFHFQSDYFPEKVTNYLVADKDGKWIRFLAAAFESFFIKELELERLEEETFLKIDL